MSFPWHAENPPEALATLRDVPLAKLVRDDVLGMILRGDLRPGQRINEPDVASRLGVSRVPVREALRELESTGLVAARKHAGVFVHEPDADEIRDLYELRAALDRLAGCRTAALPAKARGVLADALAASIADMRAAAAAHEVQRYYASNLQFHWAIVEAAGNRAMADAYRGVVQKLHLSRLKNLSNEAHTRASIAEHVAIAAALRAGDAARCEAAMVRHVGDAYARFARLQAPAEATSDWHGEPPQKPTARPPRSPGETR